MIAIHNPYYHLHRASWKFILGTETYMTRDVAERAEIIRAALEAAGGFDFQPADRFDELWIARMHPYYGFIKRNSLAIVSDTEAIYPDLFPGEGARLPRRQHPLWAGVHCTDCVTPIMKGTFEAARGSAETALTAARILAEGEAREVYALCRPSGHHAGPRVFGGYCYFNNSAVAADYLTRQGGRVALLDIDFHHGNGTQEFFEHRPDVFTASIHCDPAIEYPYYWGYEDEVGYGAAAGTNLNVILPKSADTDAYLAACDKVMDAFQTWDADYVIVGAGFDTFEGDPIGGFNIPVESFAAIGARLSRLHCPLLIAQEGGYNLQHLGAIVTNFLQGVREARSHR